VEGGVHLPRRLLVARRHDGTGRGIDRVHATCTGHT
jgi:hypothetical protein